MTETTRRDGLTMLIVANELALAAKCRQNAATWDSVKWPGKWSKRDWIESARGHLDLARRIMQA